MKKLIAAAALWRSNRRMKDEKDSFSRGYLWVYNELLNGSSPEEIKHQPIGKGFCAFSSGAYSALDDYAKEKQE